MGMRLMLIKDLGFTFQCQQEVGVKYIEHMHPCLGGYINRDYQEYIIVITLDTSHTSNKRRQSCLMYTVHNHSRASQTQPTSVSHASKFVGSGLLD